MSFRPVDLGIPNSILNAFVQGSQIRQRKEALAQQGDLEQKRIDLEKQRIEDEHDFKQHQIDILSKGAEIERMLNLQKIGSGITQGEMLPGMQIQPSRNMPQDLPSFGEDQSLVRQPTQIPKTITVSHPSINNGQPFEIENPEEYKRSRIEEQGKLAEATEVPKRTTATTVADITTQRQAFLEYNKLIQQSVENEANRKNKIDIANINAASRLAAAKARGASSKLINLANTVSNQFNNNQIAKNYEVSKKAYNAALNPNASDYDILNAYGQISNPSAASVPGGELQILQQLPSIGSKFGLTAESILGNKNFFDTETRDKVKSSIELMHKINTGAYGALRNDTTTKLKTIGESPENWLDNYDQRIPGDIVKIGGKNRVVKAVHPDKSFDLEDE